MDTSPTNPYREVNLILFCLLVFTPLARGGFPYWAHAVIYLGVLASLTLLLFKRIHTSKPLFIKTPLDKPLLALSLWFLISLLFSTYRPASFEAAALLFSYVAFYYLLIHTIRTRKQQRHLVYVIITVALVLSIIGFLQRFDLIPVLRDGGSGGAAGSLTSIYGNHNHIAGYLEMAIPLLLGLFLTQSQRGLNLFLMLYALVVLISAHLLTLSRGGWLSLVLSFLFMGIILLTQKSFRSKKTLLTTFVALIFVVFLVLVSTNIVERIMTVTDQETVVGLNGRSIAWDGTVEMIKDNWLLGSGPGTYATIFSQYQPPGITARFFYAHNDYLHYTAEIGLPLLIIMGWFLYVLFRTGFKKIKDPSRHTWGVTLGAMTGIIAILVHSIIDFNLHFPANAILFVTLVALVIGDNHNHSRT